MGEPNTQPSQEIVIDVPERNVIEMTVFSDGQKIASRSIPYTGPVDSQLLTTIDNLLQENILRKFASIYVKPGEGVDKSTLLYRIIITLGAAMERVGSWR